MKNVPSQKDLRRIPKRFSLTESRYHLMPISEMPISMHFYTNNRDWYILEFDRKNNSFYGYSLNRLDFNESFLDNFSLENLTNYHELGDTEVIWDDDWIVKKVSDVDVISKSLGILYRSSPVGGSDELVIPTFYEKLSSFLRFFKR